ncbi:MAG: hypothetical protein CMO44_17265 [Verrucomicrobiales bacterium]|nr:hypothetical protein [Verrucomicrobiales bacterium]
MAELLVLEDVPLHVFCSIARVFYGALVSFPYSMLLRVILSRIVLWVIFFVLGLDVLQMVVILNRFNAVVLADALSILFSIVSILLDLYFMLNLYHMSIEGQLELRTPEPAKQPAKQSAKQVVPEATLPTSIETNPDGLFRRSRIRF